MTLHTDTELAETVSKTPSAKMHYTADNYLEKVVMGLRTELVGWPAGIPFGNVSDLKGGNAVVERLLRELRSGRMYFRRVSTRRARKISTRRITPEMCLPTLPRRGRSDVKVHCLRTVKMALWPLTGPKTPATIEETDSESEGSEYDEDEIVEGTTDEGEAMTDEIEQWTEDEEL